jgi:hypothetical protein
MGGGREAAAGGAERPKEGTVEPSSGMSVSRLSWEHAHRLELTLRARATRFGAQAGHCPGCGRPVSPGEDQLRLAGSVVHPGCLRDDALA